MDESKGGERMNLHFCLRRLGLALMALVALSILAACGGGPTGITNAVMAKNVQGDAKDPVDVTNSFPADQALFHAVVTVSNLASGSKVKAVWTVVDVGSAASPDTKITETEVTVEGSRNVDFTLTPNAGQLPPGKFKVEIYLNDKLDRTLQFTVG
jgi:hypothetical protein